MHLLYGYYGEQNAGDDAFTAVCATELHRRGQGPIGVLSAALPRIPSLPARALYLRRRWRGLADRIEQRRVDSWLRQGASLTVGGGSLFRSTAGMAEMTALLDRAPGGLHRALGVSIGPFRDDDAAAACAALLPRFAAVTVRDHESLTRARALAPEANVTLAFDLAPLLSRQISPGSPHARPKTIDLGVALCGPALDPDAEEAVLQALTEWLSVSPDHRVVLFPFNVHPRKGDIAVHRRAATRLARAGAVEWQEYQGNPIHVWNRISQLNGMVAMRLHAAVFAYCTARPTWILPYEEKCTAWARMIDHDPAFLSEPGHLRASELTALTADGGPTAMLPVAEAIERAATNFDWAVP